MPENIIFGYLGHRDNEEKLIASILDHVSPRRTRWAHLHQASYRRSVLDYVCCFPSVPWPLVRRAPFENDESRSSNPTAVFNALRRLIAPNFVRIVSIMGFVDILVAM